MGGAFRLLHPVALHDLAVAVDADVPRATRLTLTVQHGRVRHVVVLEHALFKLALRVEVLLGKKTKQTDGANNNDSDVKFIICSCLVCGFYLLYTHIHTHRVPIIMAFTLLLPSHGLHIA